MHISEVVSKPTIKFADDTVFIWYLKKSVPIYHTLSIKNITYDLSDPYRLDLWVSRKLSPIENESSLKNHLIKVLTDTFNKDPGKITVSITDEFTIQVDTSKILFPPNKDILSAYLLYVGKSGLIDSSDEMLTILDHSETPEITNEYLAPIFRGKNPAENFLQVALLRRHNKFKNVDLAKLANTYKRGILNNLVNVSYTHEDVVKELKKHVNWPELTNPEQVNRIIDKIRKDIETEIKLGMYNINGFFRLKPVANYYSKILNDPNISFYAILNGYKRDILSAILTNIKKIDTNSKYRKDDIKDQLTVLEYLKNLTSDYKDTASKWPEIAAIKTHLMNLKKR